jgi:uroporphyrinogen decarboxylase
MRAELRRVHPHTPVILFAKGAHHSLEQQSRLGYEVLGLDWTADAVEARRATGGRVVLMGNLHPAVLQAGAAAIERETARALAALGPQHLIANLGHGLQPDHTPEQVACYLRAVRAFPVGGPIVQ